MRAMSIETISDQMLRDLFTTEQITPQRYMEEIHRREPEPARPANSATTSYEVSDAMLSARKAGEA